jgi:glycosyltransferase involved in cell wall biosynthesis
MPRPVLSIVIANYNHTGVLPRMLASIAKQTLKDLEVVLVNDAGSEPCDTLARDWMENGLPLRLWQCPERLGPHLSRLAGLEAARGQVLLFADADDVLWGTDVLEKNVAALVDDKLDILEFGALNIDEENAGQKPWPAAPLGDFLERPGLFSAFCRGRIDGHVLWNLLLSQSLCRRAGADGLLRNPRVTRCEDHYFKIFLMLHAERYAGVPACGYGYYNAGNYERSLASAASTLCEIISTVIPALRARGHDADVLMALRAGAMLQTQRIVRNMYFELCENYGLDTGELPDGVLCLLREQALGGDTLERLLLLGYPVEVYAQNRALKEKYKKTIESKIAGIWKRLMKYSS